MSRTRKWWPALAVAAIASLALSGVASAHGGGSIVYVKNHDVWLANPDGTGEYRVTTGGTYARPWRSPSQADDGTIAAGYGNEIVRMRQNGQVLNRIDPPPLYNSVSHPMDGAPVNVAISPNGKLIAWSFVSYECPVGASCGARAATGYTAADRLTPPERHGTTYFDEPSWIGNGRTIQSGGYGSQINLHDLGKGEPAHWFDDRDHAEPSTDLADGELSPDGRRLAVIRGYGDSSQVYWYRVQGNAKSGPPPALPTPQCETSTLDGLAGPTWSPDSQALAWTEPDGIWLKTDPDVCDQPQPRLLIKGGSQPDWGPAPVAPGPRAPATAGVKVAKVKLGRALKRGLAVTVRAPAAGKVTVQVRRGARIVAKANGRARRAGNVKLVARFTKKARRGLGRAKRAKLTVNVKAAGGTGRATVTLRR